MAERVTCLGCQQTLRIPAGSGSRWLTCPRCLSLVATPEATAPGAIQAEAPARPPAPSAVGIQAELAPRSSIVPAAGLDVDARRDSSATLGCLVLLVIPVVLGIAGSLWALAEKHSVLLIPP
jgi:hypothetical protein